MSIAVLYYCIIVYCIVRTSSKIVHASYSQCPFHIGHVFGYYIFPDVGLYGFCVQSIAEGIGTVMRITVASGSIYIIILAKSRPENRSRIARYWLPRSKECADLHDVSSSFVRELERNNNNNNMTT